MDNEDFYMTKEGYKCFTEKYHLKRGYCCKSNCKHCPYGFNPKFFRKHYLRGNNLVIPFKGRLNNPKKNFSMLFDFTINKLKYTINKFRA